MLRGKNRSEAVAGAGLVRGPGANGLIHDDGFANRRLGSVWDHFYGVAARSCVAGAAERSATGCNELLLERIKARSELNRMLLHAVGATGASGAVRSRGRRSAMPNGHHGTRVGCELLGRWRQ